MTDSGGILTCGMFVFQPELQATRHDSFRWYSDILWHVFFSNLSDGSGGTLTCFGMFDSPFQLQYVCR